MGTAYKLCDCKFNDTRLEENIPLSINQELLKLNNKEYISSENPNYSIIENIKRKNATNLIIKNYRKYKIRNSFDISYDNPYTPKVQTLKSDNSNPHLNKINYTHNVNRNNGNYNSEKYYSNNIHSSLDKYKNKKTLVYLGEKLNDIKEGFGIKIMPNNVKYIGYFKNNKSEGLGKFININKQDIYYGEFSNDQANGFGIYRHKNESIYYGEWKNDLRENIGIEKWQDKAEYKGEFHLGEKNGIGKYIFSDGSRYEGEWEKNNLEGFGIYYYLGQRIYIGQWKNNLKEGFGLFIWKDKIYIGFYANDKKMDLVYIIGKISKKLLWAFGKMESSMDLGN